MAITNEDIERVARESNMSRITYLLEKLGYKVEEKFIPDPTGLFRHAGYELKNKSTKDMISVKASADKDRMEELTLKVAEMVARNEMICGLVEEYKTAADSHRHDIESEIKRIGGWELWKDCEKGDTAKYKSIESPVTENMIYGANGIFGKAEKIREEREQTKKSQEKQEGKEI